MAKRKHDVFVVTGMAHPFVAFEKRQELVDWLNARKVLPRTMVVYGMRYGKTNSVDVIPMTELLYA